MAKTQDTYKSLQKTHADVDFGAPAGDLNPTEDKKSLTSGSLNKQINERFKRYTKRNR